jgi:hypothetical protein
VKNRFQNLPFKFNLQRYTVGVSFNQATRRKFSSLSPPRDAAAGLYTLMSVDP